MAWQSSTMSCKVEFQVKIQMSKSFSPLASYPTVYKGKGQKVEKNSSQDGGVWSFSQWIFFLSILILKNKQNVVRRAKKPVSSLWLSQLQGVWGKEFFQLFFLLFDPFPKVMNMIWPQCCSWANHALMTDQPKWMKSQIQGSWWLLILLFEDYWCLYALQSGGELSQSRRRPISSCYGPRFYSWEASLKMPAS